MNCHHPKEEPMSKVQKSETASRRKFLAGAAAATAGAATLGFPMIVKAQGPIGMRWQSTWPSKDIFHEYALDYAKKVNAMTGGDPKIEVLPAGQEVAAVRPPAAAAEVHPHPARSVIRYVVPDPTHL